MSPPEPTSGTAPDAPVTFTADIRPLFREKDRESMRRAFDLWAYEDVVTHASAIAAKLHDGTMPCDGPWPPEQVSAFDRWVSEGTPE
jgi:hypothetical protein